MGRRRTRNTQISSLHCTECGSVTPISRANRQREKNHVKDLWCYKCMKITKHQEQRAFDHVFTMESK